MAASASAAAAVVKHRRPGHHYYDDRDAVKSEDEDEEDEDEKEEKSDDGDDETYAQRESDSDDDELASARERMKQFTLAPAPSPFQSHHIHSQMLCRLKTWVLDPLRARLWSPRCWLELEELEKADALTDEAVLQRIDVGCYRIPLGLFWLQNTCGGVEQRLLHICSSQRLAALFCQAVQVLSDNRPIEQRWQFERRMCQLADVKQWFIRPPPPPTQLVFAPFTVVLEDEKHAVEPPTGEALLMHMVREATQRPQLRDLPAVVDLLPNAFTRVWHSRVAFARYLTTFLLPEPESYAQYITIEVLARQRLHRWLVLFQRTGCACTRA